MFQRTEGYSGIISMSMGRGGMMFQMVYVYINKVEGIFSLTVRRRIMVQVLILCVAGKFSIEIVSAI